MLNFTEGHSEQSLPEPLLRSDFTFIGQVLDLALAIYDLLQPDTWDRLYQPYSPSREFCSVQTLTYVRGILGVTRE